MTIDQLKEDVNNDFCNIVFELIRDKEMSIDFENKKFVFDAAWVKEELGVEKFSMYFPKGKDLRGSLTTPAKDAPAFLTDKALKLCNLTSEQKDTLSVGDITNCIMCLTFFLPA